MVDTIIFDLGKVLVDFDPVLGMKRMHFSDEAISCFMEKIFGGPWEVCDRVNHTRDSLYDFFLSFVPGYEKEVNILLDNLPLLTGVRPYTEELLDTLKKKNMKLYVLSNYGNVSFNMNKVIYPFLSKMDGMVISYEIEECKPSLRIYQYLLDKYSIVPKTSVFIDDRIENVLAAKTLGIHGIHFKTYEDLLNELEIIWKENL